MSKHTHHETNQEQRNNKEHGAAPFHYDPYQKAKSMEPKDNPTKAALDNSSIQLRAYHIYLEKGGSDLDNWLEAERSLRQ